MYESVQRLRRVLAVLRRGGTFEAVKVAAGASRVTVKRDLAFIRKMGAEITHSRLDGQYKLTKEFKL